jgi:hypothetical protein
MRALQREAGLGAEGAETLAAIVMGLNNPGIPTPRGQSI